jgi:hypothetical protein
VLSALPIINLGNCCCLWIGGGGALASYLEQERRRPFTPADGAKAGLFAGIIGAFVWLLISVVVDAAIAPLRDRMLAEVMANASDLPPGVAAMMERFRADGGGTLQLAIGFLFQLFVGVVFATLGGFLAAYFFRRDGVPPALGGDAVVPPPLPPQ